MPLRATTMFEGTIRQLRRGGWAARGLVVTNRNSLLVETQVGPRQFDTEDLCDAWLRSAAADLMIDNVQIIVGARPEATPGAQR